MFVDKVQVSIKAGDGGNGVVSFRHEIYVDRGGPDGGDGGKGGDVILVASRNQNTLANFRFQKAIRAESGRSGSKQKKHGKSGINLRVPVPVGTVLIDEHGDTLADLQTDGQEVVVALGGKGGFGNAHFVSSVRQAPKVAERGEPGEAFDATLELKMIADVGLVGQPNAGKSTLLSVISGAKPEIANYPFTTLIPNLGVVDIDSSTSLLFADIPGLIEGASKGKGLGDEFLRHVERTKVLIHLVDAYQDDVAKAYQVIQDELASYKINLAKLPQVIALTKIEGLDEEIIDSQIAKLKKVAPKNSPIVPISAQSKQGLKELLFTVKDLVKKVQTKEDKKRAKSESEVPVYKLDTQRRPWVVTKQAKSFKVKGAKIERFALRTDFDSEEGIRRLRDIMKKMGIMRELERRGIAKGQIIHIGTIGQIEY